MESVYYTGGMIGTKLNFNSTDYYTEAVGGSVAFDGVGDGLTLTKPTFIAGDHTVSAYIYLTSTPSAERSIISISDGRGFTKKYAITISSGLQLRVSGHYTASTPSTQTFTGGTISLNTWTYIQVTRSGNVFTGYINGTSVGTFTLAWENPNSTSMSIGQNAENTDNQYRWVGNISNLRITNTVVSATVPTAPLTAISGTQLLTCQSATTITDASVNNYTITVVGNAAASSSSPFNIIGNKKNSGIWNLQAVYDSIEPPVVLDGLALYLDAGNPSSYSGTGTTWTDLSGNSRNGTLTNGVAYSSGDGGKLVFDGVNDFVQCSGSLTTTTATFIIWLNRNGAQGNYDGIFYSRGTSVTGLSFLGTSNKLSYTWNNASNTYSWDSGLLIPDLAWCMVAVSVSASSATAYLCQSSGITSNTNTVSHGSTILDDIKIAQDDFGGRFYNGSVSVAMLYNRALSVEEITQNYNAFKNRYGL